MIYEREGQGESERGLLRGGERPLEGLEGQDEVEPASGSLLLVVIQERSSKYVLQK